MINEDESKNIYAVYAGCNLEGYYVQKNEKI